MQCKPSYKPLNRENIQTNLHFDFNEESLARGQISNSFLFLKCFTKMFYTGEMQNNLQ